MRRFCILILLAAVLFGSCVSSGSKTETGLSLQDAIEQSAEKNAAELPRGSRVAVVAFDSENNSLSEYIMNELIGALKDQGIDVVDRQNLDLAITELNLQRSEYFDENTARRLGKFLGADIVITGTISAVGDMYRFRTNAIDVETAAIASIARLDVRNDRTMQSMAGGTQ